MPPERWEDPTTEAVLRASENLVWAALLCPRCNRKVSIGLMSLAATCPCGMYYVDADKHRGWYRSWEAYTRGEGPVE